jgi:hypothetical protein
VRHASDRSDEKTVIVRGALKMTPMRRQPVETDFKIEVLEDKIIVAFLPTMSVYTFTRLITERDIAEFGPVSPDPVERHPSRGGVRSYRAGDVRAMAFRLATSAARIDV